MRQNHTDLYQKLIFTHTRQPMKSILHTKLNEIIAYMRPLLLQGVDITGLYIVQAHLTSFKTVLKPISILTSLFSNEELIKMLAITKKRVDQLKSMQGRYEVNGKQTEFDDIQRFQLSVKDFNIKPLEDLAVLAEQLLETLQEWDIIQTKSQRFRSSLQNQTINSSQIYTNEELKDELQVQLQMLALYNNEKEFKITQSTECFSSFEQQQIAVSLKKLGEADVSMMFQYIVRWSNEVYHEIQDFKALIEITKDQKSSVDFDLQNFMPRATEFTCGSLKLGKQKKQISNVDDKTKASSKLRTSKQNLIKGQLKSSSFQIKSLASDFDKIKRQTVRKDHSSKVLSDFSNQIARRRQIKALKNDKESCKCEIF